MSNITDSFNTFVSNLSTNVNTISTTFNSLQNDIINNQFVKKSGDTMTGLLNVTNIDSYSSLNIGQNATSISIGSTNNNSKTINIGGINDIVNISSNINLPNNSIPVSKIIDGVSKTYVDSNLSILSNNIPTSISQIPITSNLNLNSNKITNLADPVNNNDAVTKSYIDNAITIINNAIPTSVNALPVNSDLNMNSYKVINLATPTENNDGVNKSYADTAFNTVSNSIPTSLNSLTVDLDLDLGNKKIVNLATPTLDTDATTKNYVDTKIITNNNITDGSINTTKLIGVATTNDGSLYLNNKGQFMTVVAPGIFGNEFTSNVNANNYNVQNLKDPILTQDAATKNYVDTKAGSITSYIGCFEAFSSSFPPSSGYLRQGSTGNSATLYPDLASKLAISNTLTSTARTLPSTGDWSNVIYGTKFVALKRSSTTIATSTDGITWSSVTIPFTMTNYSNIAYGNNLYILLNTNSTTYATSVDTITWTTRTLPISASYWNGFSYLNNKFIGITGNGNNSIISTDGITWTQGTLPGSSLYWNTITYAYGLYIALVSNTTTYATSPDGITWTSRTLPINAYIIKYVNNILFAIISNSTIYLTSKDGISWTQNYLPSSDNFVDIIYGNNTYIIDKYGGASGRLASIDGINWISFTLSDNSSMKSIAYGNNTFVIGCADSSALIQVITITGSLTSTTTFTVPSITEPTGIQYWISTKNNNIIPFNNTFTTNIDAQNNKIINLQDPINNQDAITKNYIDNKFATNSTNIGIYEAFSTSFPPTTGYLRQGTTASSSLYPDLASKYAQNTLVYTTTIISYNFNNNYNDSFVYLNGIFVLLDNTSNTNKIYTSSDGTSWTQYTLPISANWKGIIYGGGKFVCYGNNSTTSTTVYIAYSTNNCATWLYNTLTITGTIQKMAFGNNRFVILIYNSTTTTTHYYSSDAITWFSFSLSTYGDYLQDIAFGNGIFIILRYNNSYYYTSIDGNTWTLRNGSLFTNNDSIIFGNGYFIVNRYSGGADISITSDGINWTIKNTVSTIDNWPNIFYGNNTFILTTNTNTYPSMAFSTDNGYTWTYCNRSFNGSYAIAYGNGRFIAINNSSNTNILYNHNCQITQSSTFTIPTIVEPTNIQYWMSTKSSNGVSFDNKFTTNINAQNYNIQNLSNPINIQDAATKNYVDTKLGVSAIQIGQFQAFSSSFPPTTGYLRQGSTGNSSILYPELAFKFASTSLITTSGTLPISSITTIRYVNNKFIAAASGTQIISSTDGITWTISTVPNITYNNIFYGNGLYLAVGSSSIYATSLDGFIWTQRSLPGSITGAYCSIYFNNLYIIIAYNSVIYYTSSDGINWNINYLIISGNWISITEVNGLLIAIANNTTSYITSTDGITWTNRTLPSIGNWNCIKYINNIVYLTQSSNTSSIYLRSTDCINWIEYNFPTPINMVNIDYYKNYIIVIPLNVSYFYYSINGIDWNTLSVSGNTWNYIATNNDIAVVTNSSNTSSYIISISTNSTFNVPSVNEPTGIQYWIAAKSSSGTVFTNTFTDNINANNYKITNLSDPIVSTGAATKNYVDKSFIYNSNNYSSYNGSLIGISCKILIICNDTNITDANVTTIINNLNTLIISLGGSTSNIIVNMYFYGSGVSVLSYDATYDVVLYWNNGTNTTRGSNVETVLNQYYSYGKGVIIGLYGMNSNNSVSLNLTKVISYANQEFSSNIIIPQTSTHPCLYGINNMYISSYMNMTNFNNSTSIGNIFGYNTLCYLYDNTYGNRIDLNFYPTNSLLNDTTSRTYRCILQSCLWAGKKIGNLINTTSNTLSLSNPILPSLQVINNPTNLYDVVNYQSVYSAYNNNRLKGTIVSTTYGTSICNISIIPTFITWSLIETATTGYGTNTSDFVNITIYSNGSSGTNLRYYVRNFTTSATTSYTDGTEFTVMGQMYLKISNSQLLMRTNNSNYTYNWYVIFQ